MSHVDIKAMLAQGDPPGDGGYPETTPRYGFFTDTSVCIGCKACEVACKEWNHVPDDGLDFTGMSYDNSVGLGADTWRHVAFIEQRKPLGNQQTANRVDLGMPGLERPGQTSTSEPGAFRWLMSSDVCKHCTHAGCLDVCPTGALFRTEFGTVVVQEDVCNGCGYCVSACPYGVIDQRTDDGAADIAVALGQTVVNDHVLTDLTRGRGRGGLAHRVGADHRGVQRALLRDRHDIDDIGVIDLRARGHRAGRQGIAVL